MLVCQLAPSFSALNRTFCLHCSNTRVVFEAGTGITCAFPSAHWLSSPHSWRAGPCSLTLIPCAPNHHNNSPPPPTIPMTAKATQRLPPPLLSSARPSRSIHPASPLPKPPLICLALPSLLPPKSSPLSNLPSAAYFRIPLDPATYAFSIPASAIRR